MILIISLYELINYVLIWFVFSGFVFLITITLHDREEKEIERFYILVALLLRSL